ncbi:MAG: UvrB/UvrC motif-containing protein [Thermomicrobiales bacterium]
MTDISADSQTGQEAGPRGVAVIEAALATMPLSPGVYRMLDGKGNALYVGKARVLRKRVAAYTQLARLPERLRRMVSETVAMEIITTYTEAEALLLEANLIKKLKPRFNIVLRDDKSYPWLMLSEGHDFPQITKHRGARARRGTYWGPFASTWAVNQTVTALERVFLLRSCADTVFAHRSRPCLLHQIRRCSAPCVGRIDRDSYAALVAQARAFLSGQQTAVQRALAAEMEAAAAVLEFERAAAIRDRIRALTHVQGTDIINPASLGDADVIALWQTAGQSCIQVFFVRGGRNNGNRAFFPTHARTEEPPEVLGRLHRPVLRRQAAAAPAAAHPRAAGTAADRGGAAAEGRDLRPARAGRDRGAATGREARRRRARRTQRPRGAGAPPRRDRGPGGAARRYRRAVRPRRPAGAHRGL